VLHLITESDWLLSLRSELAEIEPLQCPHCSSIVDSQALQANRCGHCGGALVAKSAASKRTFSALARIAIVLLAVAGLIAFILGAGVLRALQATSHGSTGGLTVGAIVVVAIVLAGMTQLVGWATRSWSHAAGPKDDAFYVVSSLAKAYSKDGKAEKAGRLYAEELTYGYRRGLFNTTGGTFNFWEQQQPLTASYAPQFRALLFYDQLKDFLKLMEQADVRKSAVDECIARLKSLGGDEDRMLSLGTIYCSDPGVAKVAAAVSAPHAALAEALRGQRGPSLGFVRNVESPIQPANDPALATRSFEGACSRCGTQAKCMGLDVYSAFAVRVRHPNMPALTFTWMRWLSLYEIRLCDTCLSTFSSTPASAALSLEDLSKCVAAFVKGCRGMLAAASADTSLTLAPHTNPRTMVTFDISKIRFVIEPMRPTEAARQLGTDAEGNQWVIWDTDVYNKCAAPANAYTPHTLSGFSLTRLW